MGKIQKLIYECVVRGIEPSDEEITKNDQPTDYPKVEETHKGA